MKTTFDTIDPKHLDNTTGGGPVGDAAKNAIDGIGEGLPFPKKGQQQKRPCIVCGLG